MVAEKKEYKVVYSLGPNCQTDIFLSQHNLRKLSSIIGSSNIKEVNTIKEILENDSSILFDPHQHIYTRFGEEYRDDNAKHGFRTIIKKFDSGFEDATLPYQELWRQETKLHFTRGVKRLKKIREEKIPILFIYMVWERNAGEHFKTLTDKKALEDLSIWTKYSYNSDLIIVILHKDKIKPYLEKNKIGAQVLGCYERKTNQLAVYLKNNYQIDNLISIEDLEENQQ